MDSAIFKCRKCRHFLFTNEKIASAHDKTNENCQDLEKDKYVWFLRDDILEEWMELQLNQGNWIKGKLFCPLCNGRIGSYDFVSGAQCSCGNVLPAVHIVKSKVDYEKKSEIDGIREKIHMPPTISKTNELCLSEQTVTTIKPLLMCNQTVLEHSKQETKGTNSVTTEERCPIPAEGTSGFKFENVNKKYDFIKERKQKKQKVQKRSKVSISQKMYVQRKNNEEMPQLSPDKSKTLWNSLTCAVCLDIYFSPFICRPCGHTFCESCLRVIAKPNPTKTCCPLCRRPIGCCELNRDVSKQAMISFPLEYNNRLQENKFEVENLPLPWTPHYHFRNFTSFGRNLLTNQPESGIRNIWTAFCLSLPTIAILIFLNVFSIAMFLLSYFGCSYIPTVMTYLSSLIWQIFTSHVSTKSNETYEFKGLHGTIASVFILVGFTATVTIIVYFKLRSLLTREH